VLLLLLLLLRLRLCGCGAWLLLSERQTPRGVLDLLRVGNPHGLACRWCW
jgi:hypothetical protein